MCNGNTRKKERAKGIEKIFEATMNENFPNLISDNKPQVPEDPKASVEQIKNKNKNYTNA